VALLSNAGVKIGQSGTNAEKAINEVLEWADPEALKALGIEKRDAQFFYPVRSCLILACKKA
jgi:hypothetical protein